MKKMKVRGIKKNEEKKVKKRIWIRYGEMKMHDF